MAGITQGDHRGVAWIDEAEQSLGAHRSEGSEPFPIRTDVDDAIERDDVGGRVRFGELDEVAAVNVRDAIGVAASLTLGARGRDASTSVALAAPAARFPDVRSMLEADPRGWLPVMESCCQRIRSPRLLRRLSTSSSGS
jgi:hypothetical protein